MSSAFDQASHGHPPTTEECWRDKIRILRQGESYVEAVKLLMARIREHPACDDTFAELAKALFALGLTDRAIRFYEQAVQLAPEKIWHRVNLCAMYHHAERATDCIRLGETLLELDPASTLAHINVGLSYFSLMDWERSMKHLRAAVNLAPTHVGAWINLGLVQDNAGYFEEAEASFREAVALEPAAPTQRVCLATTILRNGQFKEGWRLFSSRFENDPALKLAGDTPLWQGQDLSGQSIHIFPEQGLGDLVQFIRFAKLLADRGARVVATVPAMLQELLCTVPGLSAVYTPGDTPIPCHYQSTVMELPRWLEIDEATIPLARGYLTIPSGCEASEVQPFPGKLKIGIVWAGNPKHVNDRCRSMNFSDLEPLLDLSNVQVMSLQMGPKRVELQNHHRRAEIVDCSLTGESATETARVLSGLDMVVTVDTFVAHLAGALGVPTWLMVAKSPDWRWLEDRADSPWYESVRIFRQVKLMCWKKPVHEVCEAIRELSRE